MRRVSARRKLEAKRKKTMTELYHEPQINSTLYGFPKDFNLTADDIAHRSMSFVDEQTLRLGGVRRVNNDVGHQILGLDTRKNDYSGLAIPYLNVFNGLSVMEFNIRRDNPDEERDGEGNIKIKRKYIKPRTTKNLLYIPPIIKAELLKDKKKKRIFVIGEGELKILAMVRVASNNFTSEDWHFIPLGISGVDNYKTKTKITKEDGEKVEVSRGLPELDLIEWKNSIVIICFDSDVQDKPTVRAARNRINRFFRERKIKTFNLNFPKEFEGIETKGIDDYLGAIESKYDTQTAIDSMLDMIESAQKPKKLKTPIADNFELIDFGMGENPGVYYTDENGESFKVCSPLRIVAETQTEAGENYGRLLEWRDSQNRLHRWAMPIEFVHSQGSDLAKYLASNGLEIMPSRKHHEKLAFYIATSTPEKVVISTDKIGWHGECFVLPGKTFGDCDNEIVYQTEYEGHHLFKTSGNLKDWQENISKFCPQNSRLLFAVSSAFSAPLLSIVQMQGGGFHFRGSTSTGKTTASLVAGSVWGGDSEHGFPQTWKATANGLEIVAAGHNHALLCLDEIGECESREVGNVAYMLANGRGKMRMTKTIQARHSLSWNLLFISTGELSLSDKILENGGTVKGGQEIRLCDIEADTGVFGLFEDLHTFSNGQMFSDHLRANSCQFYGTPIHSFLDWLTEYDQNDLKENWHEFKNAFIDEIVKNKKKVPSEVLRVAARFALVAFGGELATESGVTKWQPNEATEAAKTVFKQWLGGREGNGQSDIERGLRKVVSFLNSNEALFYDLVIKSADLEKSEFQNIFDAAGYKRRNSSGQIEYLIFPDKFRYEICKGSAYKTIEKALIENGSLETDSAGNPTKNVKIDGIQKRFYVITQRIFEVVDEKENEKELKKNANV